MPDYKQRVLDSQGKLRQLQARLPGFKGYMAKESRREADKMLRSALGRELDQQKSRLKKFGTAVATAGNMNGVAALEPVRMRLQTVSDKIKTATYGYAGFFDAATVNEKELDALYDFDNSLIDHVNTIKAAVEVLVTKAPDQPFDESLATVGDAVDELSTVWVKRQDVVIGGSI